jgi:phosphoserine phosphatase
MAKKLIEMAIAYDFDGTLAPGNMQEYNFIPELKISPQDFWNEAKKLAKKQESDEILAYMRVMLQKADHAEIPVRKVDFQNFGKDISLFPGVETWFKRVNKYARDKGIKISHYIISSGIREMIEGTKIAKEFEKIYASGFMYDHNMVANWPALAVNYTTKTQYLFRINKGSLDIHDNSKINKFVPNSERPVPFENIVFIGDGETDIPCMKLVKQLGGHSIAVYTGKKKGAKNNAKKLIDEDRASFVTKADYSEGSAIEKAVKLIIDKVSAHEQLKLVKE